MVKGLDRGLCVVKPNHACTQCGMWSGRKGSVKRHISLVHPGKGDIVSFVEYVIGVNSGKYSPPTYTPMHLNNKKTDTKQAITISASHISVSFQELRNPLWTQKLDTALRDSLSRDPPDPAFDVLLKLYGPHLRAVPILYTGYVCRNCLSIGIVIDNDQALDLKTGGHECDLATLVKNASYIPDHMERIYERLNRGELPKLLHTVIKAFRMRIPTCCLIAQEVNSDARECSTIDAVNSPWIERLVQSGRLIANDDTLMKFFAYGRATYGVFAVKFPAEIRKYHIITGLDPLVPPLFRNEWH